LRVVSANLLNGNVDPAWLRDLVSSMEADVVALQEADALHYEAVSEALPYGRFAEGENSTGLGIALRRPAERFESVPLAWREAQEVVLHPQDWPELERPLQIMNVHVVAPHARRPPFFGLLLRRKQVRGLEAHFEKSGDPRRLVIGDLNATPIWPVYRRLAAQFTDAAIAVAQRQGRGVEPTWGFKDGRRLLRIDHALTRGVHARDFHVVALEGSDHSAIVVDLSV
jgi:endonuclease/exonuclease/phosphatase family metal-dependent hydrolase